MTITIEGLPKNQKIKNIQFNVEFLEDQNDYSDKSIKNFESNISLKKIEPIMNFNDNQDLIKPNIEMENRESKEVPKEMLDMEF